MDDAEETVERWLEVARGLLGEGDDARTLERANHAVNQALGLAPDYAPAWIVKCQLATARGDDLAALAAAEAAITYAPTSAVAHYWRGALLGDLGHGAIALAAIERAFLHLCDDDNWLLEDLYFEKATLLDALGDRDAAAATYRAGLTRCPGSQLLRAGLDPGTPPVTCGSALKLLRGGLS